MQRELFPSALPGSRGAGKSTWRSAVPAKQHEEEMNRRARAVGARAALVRTVGAVLASSRPRQQGQGAALARARHSGQRANRGDGGERFSVDRGCTGATDLRHLRGFGSCANFAS